MEDPVISSSPTSGSSCFDTNRFRSVKVFIYTTTGLFSGYTYCQHQQRLLDALNKGFYTSKLQTSSDFLPLFDLEVLSLSGVETRHMDTVFIRKSNIILVGEGVTVAPSGPINAYPIRRKKAVQAVINLPQVSLTGSMYSELWEEIQDALNRSEQFIPVTDVSFEPPLPGGATQSGFVAVNKDHIVYVGK